METIKTQLNDNKAIVSIRAAGSIDAYIAQINQIPILTSTEEFDLATKFKIDGDLEAARKLIMSHLRFVSHVAKNYLGYGLSRADLIQEGTIGLMKAVKRFDPKMGVRLVSFAVYWIKAEIHEFILKNWRIVKIATTKAQRKLFFNLRRATKKLQWFDNDEVTKVANNLNVNPKEVRLMEARMHNQDVAFDNYSDDDETNWDNPASYLEAKNQDPIDMITEVEADQIQNEGLTQALESLEERKREIVKRRWLQENKATLHELAAEYKISAERVRQIENSALKQLKTTLKHLPQLSAASAF